MHQHKKRNLLTQYIYAHRKPAGSSSAPFNLVLTVLQGIDIWLKVWKDTRGQQNFNEHNTKGRFDTFTHFLAPNFLN
jgi:hypothetical protein